MPALRGCRWLLACTRCWFRWRSSRWWGLPGIWWWQRTRPPQRSWLRGWSGWAGSARRGMCSSRGRLHCWSGGCCWWPGWCDWDFLANFLSRTVLVGFLTGVGIQVAFGQLGPMLGITPAGSQTATTVINTLKALPHLNVIAALVSLGVIVLVVGIRQVTHRIPGALIAVIGAIALSKTVHLAGYRVEVLGAIPHGLPQLAIPSFAVADLGLLFAMAVSMFVVIVAQSSATSRAYAATYEETVNEDRDLVGLAGANLSAAFTGGACQDVCVSCRSVGLAEVGC
jgi:MFS superfamily sulfate permease-like transporter